MGCPVSPGEDQALAPVSGIVSQSVLSKHGGQWCWLSSPDDEVKTPSEKCARLGSKEHKYSFLLQEKSWKQQSLRKDLNIRRRKRGRAQA